MVATDTDRAARARHCALLWALGALFLLRVLGQALVAFLDASSLPPMAMWQSGLLPYPLLLAAQVLILGLQAWVGIDLARGAGVWVGPRPRLGRALGLLSAVYGTSMALRYGLTMAWHPERRWLGQGTIPIVFHFVLAAWLATLGHWLGRRA